MCWRKLGPAPREGGADKSQAAGLRSLPEKSAVLHTSGNAGGLEGKWLEVQVREALDVRES